MAVSDEQMARINFLARKSKAEGLTLEERQEQIELRQAYIQAVKDSLTPLLESIRVVNVDENGRPIDETIDVEIDAQHARVDEVTIELETHDDGSDASR